jgi:HEAT repeat protein
MIENTVSNPALDSAFAALANYDHGSGRGSLMALDEAVGAATADANARQALEARLLGVLRSQASPLAKEYVCRKLAMIGSARSVPALAELLAHKQLAHLACQALEAIPGAEALRALRGSVPKLGGLAKLAVLQSLGLRRDAESVPALTALLADADAQTACAAAVALGEIGTLPAAQALQQFRPAAPERVKDVVIDALLACAEALAAEGKKSDALAIYKSLAAAQVPKHVKLAATRGMLLGTQMRDP